MDVVAWGNEGLKRLEQWGPFRARYRSTEPVAPAPADRFAAFDQVETGIPHFDLSGNPISFREWAERAEDPDYHHQALDYVRSDKGLVRVSTIWLGHSIRFWGDGPPVIFETMTFSADSDEYDQQQWRFCRLEDALEGHRKITEHLAQSWWLNLGGRG